VIVHDFVVDDTTNGKGRVIEMTLAELKALDAGSWFGSQYAGTQIPTLDEVFEAVGHRLFVNVEIKAEFADSDGVEQVVADCISRHNMQERVLITSFNPPTLNRFRALMPSIPIGYLYEGDQFKALPTDASYEAYNPYYELIDPAMIEACRAQQIYINVWTMNDPARAVDLARLGVAGIITDNPDTVIAALKAAGLGE